LRERDFATESFGARFEAVRTSVFAFALATTRRAGRFLKAPDKTR
jgi:hypothetical protein